MGVEAKPTEDVGAPMTTVHVDLEDGFHGDAVELWSGPQRLARLEGVTTRPQIGLAEQVSVDVPAGATLTVRRDEDRLDVVIDGASPHVGIGAGADGLTVHTSATPFMRA